MSDKIDVIMKREKTEQDERLMSAISDLREQSQQFKIDYFELGYSQDETPAVRVSVEIPLSNRILFKAPSLSSSKSIEANISSLREILSDTASLRSKVPTRR